MFGLWRALRLCGLARLRRLSYVTFQGGGGCRGVGPPPHRVNCMARQPFLVAIDYPPTTRMVEDLLLVSDQPLDELRQIVERVHHETGFLTLDRLTQLAAETLSVPQAARAVANTIYSVHPDDTDRPVADITDWLQLNPTRAADVTTGRLEAVGERVRLLAQRYPALERRRKADHLAQLAGPRCDGADILCDLRPVFDAGREQIEGLMPLITLRLQVVQPNGDPSVYEVRLTEWMLGQLVEKAERAKQKVQVLAGRAGEWVADGWLGLDGKGGAM